MVDAEQCFGESVRVLSGSAIRFLFLVTRVRYRYGSRGRQGVFPYFEAQFRRQEREKANVEKGNEDISSVELESETVSESSVFISISESLGCLLSFHSSKLVREGLRWQDIDRNSLKSQDL